MPTVKKKTGRKPKPYVCPWNNETIDGLYHCPDGRWRIIATGEKFSERNPRLAVARFRNWQAQQRGDERRFAIPLGPLTTVGPIPDAPVDDQAALAAVLRHELGPGDHFTPKDDSLALHIPANTDPIRLLRAIPEAAYYACVAEDLITRPKHMAEGTGIEQLGYLPTLTKPVPSPKLSDVGDYFFQKKATSMKKDWFGKCKVFWKEFSESVGVETIREITQTHVKEYEKMITDAVIENNFQPPYTRQRLEAIRSIVNLTIVKQSHWQADCTHLKGLLAVIEKPKASDANPKPIRRKDFRTLLDASDDFMRAILLASLNLCMYSGEVATLKWAELNFEKKTFVSNRTKTGVVRAGVLWDRTIEALLRIPRAADAKSVFISSTGMQHNYKTIYPYFRRLREQVGLDHHVQFSHIRDGAYTAACEHPKVKDSHAEILAGHKTNIKDRYVKRRPKIVVRACRAVEAVYFPQPKPTEIVHHAQTPA